MIDKLLWCPIDLPKCPVIPSLVMEKNWYFWNFVKITESQQSPYEKSFIKDNILKNYPELVDWFSLFPYRSIRNIKLNEQVKEVKPHIDFTKPQLDFELYENNQNNEPCGYRVLLKGSRKNALYVIKDNNKVYCNMPEETDVYVLGHTSTMHGVEEDSERLTFFIHLEIDAVKHEEILQRSLNKYKQYAIFM
jgi:hypothetical protein